MKDSFSGEILLEMSFSKHLLAINPFSILSNQIKSMT